MIHRLVLLVAVAVSLAAAEPGAAAARRIVSLVPAVTEIIFAVGAGSRVVAVSNYDHEPPDVERLPRVGALLDPDLERILSLDPDLVVIYGSQEELRSQLRRASVPVFDYRHGGLQGIWTTVDRIGRQTGRVEEAAALVRRARADLERVRSTVRDRPRPKVLLVMGRDVQSLRNIFVSGGVGFLHEVLEIAGGANAFADVRREGLQVSVEQVLARRPDVILEVRAQAQPDAELETTGAWQAVPAVPAVRNRRVHLMRGTDLVVPGPRIARAAERIAALLHRQRVR